MTGARGLLAIVLAVAACTSNQSESPRASDERAPAEIGSASPAPANAGPLGVRVTYSGAPVIETFAINKDPGACGDRITIEKLVMGSGGGLANAVASVPDVEGARVGSRPRSQPQLDQRGCAFRPRVVAMQTGELEILNSDGVLHNVHTYSTRNPTINTAQPKFKKTMDVRFRFDHPYFDVTGAGGVATIEHVPAGRHTVALWHEVLGYRRREVEVKAGERTQLTVAWE